MLCVTGLLQPSSASSFSLRCSQTPCAHAKSWPRLLGCASWKSAMIHPGPGGLQAPRSATHPWRNLVSAQLHRSAVPCLVGLCLGLAHAQILRAGRESHKLP